MHSIKDGRPIQFIEINQDGQFSVTAQAMNILEKHQSRQLAVVAISGQVSSGKSFLSNQILKYLEPNI